jgi:beta-lactamase regulating signal transducer with metallopeptidase domain
MDTGVVVRILLLVGVFILLFLPTVWAIRDIAYRRFPAFKAKAIWFAVVTLLPPIGAFVYVAVGRPRASKVAGDVEAQEVDAEVEQDEPGG